VDIDLGEDIHKKKFTIEMIPSGGSKKKNAQLPPEVQGGNCFGRMRHRNTGAWLKNS